MDRLTNDGKIAQVMRDPVLAIRFFLKKLQKLLKDCMTALGFWADDALVASEVPEKFWADIPGIFIRIEETQNPS